MSVTGQVRSIEPTGKTALDSLSPRPEQMTGRGCRVFKRIRVQVRNDLRDIRPGDDVRLRVILRPPPTPSLPDGVRFCAQGLFRAHRCGRVCVGWRDADRPVGGILHRHSGQPPASRPDGANSRGQPPGEGACCGGIVDRGAARNPERGTGRYAGFRPGPPAGDIGSAYRAGGGTDLFSWCVSSWPALSPSRCAIRSRKSPPVPPWRGAFGYLVISGATLPTQRAFMMVSIVMAAVILDRTAISLRLVALAAGLHPDPVAGGFAVPPVFRCSFAAVIALVAGLRICGTPHRREAGAGRYPVVAAGHVRRGHHSDDRGRQPRHRAVCDFPLQPRRVVRPSGEYARRTDDGDVDHAGRTAEHAADAAGRRILGAGADGVGARCRGSPSRRSSPICRTPWRWVPPMAVLALAVLVLAGLWLCVWQGTVRLLALPAAAVANCRVVPRPAARCPDRPGRQVFRPEYGRRTGLYGRRDVPADSSGNMWQRRLAVSSTLPLPRGVAEGGRLGCDEAACIVTFGNRRIAVIFDAAAAFDCRRVHHAILLSRTSPRYCGRDKVFAVYVPLVAGRCPRDPV